MEKVNGMDKVDQAASALVKEARDMKEFSLQTMSAIAAEVAVLKAKIRILDDVMSRQGAEQERMAKLICEVIKRLPDTQEKLREDGDGTLWI